MGGRRCCVPNCRSNYDSTPGYVTVFRFPKEEKMKELWLKSIPRPGFVPGKDAVVCAKHFNPEDILTHDILPTSSGDVKVPRGTPKLKDVACPSIFPLHSDVRKRKRTCPVKRQEKVKKLEEEVLENFFQEDGIGSLTNLVEGLLADKASLISSSSISLHKCEDCVSIMFICFRGKIPRIGKSITVDNELSLSVEVGGTPVNPDEFNSSLLVKGKLTYWTEFENILNFVSSLAEQPMVPYSNLGKAITYLGLHVKDLEKENTEEEEGECSSLQFLLEQLQLAYTLSQKKV